MNREQIQADYLQYACRGCPARVDIDQAEQIAADVIPYDQGEEWGKYYDYYIPKKNPVKGIKLDSMIQRLIEAGEKKTPLPALLAGLPAYYNAKYAKQGYFVTRLQCEDAWKEVIKLIGILDGENLVKLAGLIKSLPQWQEFLTEDMREKPKVKAAELRGSEYIRQRRFAPTKAGQRRQFELVPNYRKTRQSITKKTRKAKR